MSSSAPDALRIFISHSHHDNAFCQRLYDYLAQRLPGAHIFFDQSELVGGDDWMRRIQHEVVACPLFIVVLSRDSLIANWVREETNLALSRAVGDKSRRVMPVTIAPQLQPHDLDQLSPMLTTRQIIDLSKDAPASHWDDLLRVVRGEVSDAAVQVDPNRAAALQEAVEYAMLTHEAFAAGHWYDVIDQAREALARADNQRDTTLWVEMAQADEHLNRLGEAVDALDHALDVNRQRVDLWQSKARLLLRQGKAREAMVAWGSARGNARAQDAKLDLLIEQYNALAQARQFSEAVQTCDHAQQLAPNDMRWMERRLSILSQTNQNDALDYARKVSARPDASTYIWIARARLAFTLSEAMDSLNAATHLAGNGDQAVAVAHAEFFPESLVPRTLAMVGYRGFAFHGTSFIVPAVRPVPAGPFLMGSDPRRDREASGEEQPQHWVTLPSFQIAVFPVTVAEYGCYLRATGRAAFMGNLEYPMVDISWNNATAYAAWLANTTGQPWRLPTEAEWEKAARWDAANQHSRIYPWGDAFDQSRANTFGSGCNGTTPIGTYPSGASPYGAQDMAGNVWEWASSLFKRYPYNVDDGRERPDLTEHRVLRGGSWGNVAGGARAAFRYYGDAAFANGAIGLRLVLATPGS